MFSCLKRRFLAGFSVLFKHVISYAVFLGQEGGSIKANLSESLISDVASEGSWVDCVMFCQFAQPGLYALGFV